MKKHVKRGLVLFFVLLQLCGLCGCKALDNMRKNQGFYNQTGDVLWNGRVYKALPQNEYLFANIGYDTVYVTAEDVPVLLSSLFSLQELLISTDGRFLVYISQDNTYYCDEADYDAICARLEAPFEADILCYSYGVMDEDTYEYVYCDYILTDEQVSAVTHVTENTEPKVMEEGWLLDYDWSLYLEECSADMLLRRSNIELAVSDDQYYLVIYGEEQNLVYTVPDTLTSTFDQIVSVYLENEEYGWSWWDEEIIIE